jgi:hypothetical protein
MKLAGKPGTGEPYAGFDEAGAGNGPIPSTAPVLDPTCGGLKVRFLRSTRRRFDDKGETQVEDP